MLFSTILLNLLSFKKINFNFSFLIKYYKTNLQSLISNALSLKYATFYLPFYVIFSKSPDANG